MFDKLEDILVRLEEILNELNEPTVANDAARLIVVVVFPTPPF